MLRVRQLGSPQLGPAELSSAQLCASVGLLAPISPAGDRLAKIPVGALPLSLGFHRGRAAFHRQPGLPEPTPRWGRAPRHRGKLIITWFPARARGLAAAARAPRSHSQVRESAQTPGEALKNLRNLRFPQVVDELLSAARAPGSDPQVRESAQTPGGARLPELGRACSTPGAARAPERETTVRNCPARTGPAELSLARLSAAPAGAYWRQ